MVAVKAGCQYWKEQDDEALACRMTMPSRKRMEGGCLCDEVHCPSQHRPGLHLHFCSQLSCSPSCQLHQLILSLSELLCRWAGGFVAV